MPGAGDRVTVLCDMTAVAMLRHGAAGIAAYADGLLAALAARDDVELIVAWPALAPRPSAPSATFVDIPPHVREVRSRMVWRELRLPRLVRERRADVVLVPSPELPLRPLPVPSVAVVHDVFPLTSPALAGRAKRLRFGLLLPVVCARATAIACVSEATRLALHRTLGVDAAKCRVVGEGPLDLGTDPAGSAPPRPYLLYVGELFKRKNVITVLAALRDTPRLDVDLVLAGRVRPPVLAAFERQLRDWSLAGRVRHVGYVDHARLARLYRDATALVLPSVDEGFGRPLLDALAAGTPAVASDIPALRELAGEAALLVERPLDPAAWAEALTQIVTRADMREAFVERGRARARDFSWDAVAARMRTVLADAAARRGPALSA